MMFFREILRFRAEKAGENFPAFFSRYSIKRQRIFLCFLLSLLLIFSLFPLRARDCVVRAESEPLEVASPQPAEPSELENSESEGPTESERTQDSARDGSEPEGSKADNEDAETSRESSEADLEKALADVPRPENSWPSLADIGASSYLVADADTGEILYSLNPEQEAYPASMTKILTCLTVLEHPDFDPLKPVYFSERACQMPAAESSTAGFLPGEIAPTISCLYAMMMRSANEVANALAETYGGSIEGFMDLANAKAAELGCEHTHFVDPCGFGAYEHYTTATDLLKIIRHAMQNRVFQEIVKCKTYSLPPTNLHPAPGWSYIINGNYLVTFGDSGLQSPYILSFNGVKPGMTDIAGSCLASSAIASNGSHLVAIMFNAYYLGAVENSFIGPVIMSRVLLEEGAKKLGAPRIEDVREKDKLTYGWPTFPDPQKEAPVTTEPAITTEPSASLAPPPPIVIPAEESDPANISVRRWVMIVLIVLFSLLLLYFMLSLYFSISRRRRRRSWNKFDLRD